MLHFVERELRCERRALAGGTELSWAMHGVYGYCFEDGAECRDRTMCDEDGRLRRSAACNCK
jgi:hypothetical protein